MEFKEYYKLDNTPNLIIDGSPHDHSTLVLSHWKGSGTSQELIRDTSAQIVLDYLENYKLSKDIKFVSNDHFDEDGLIGIFSVLNPEYALSHKELLVDIAEAGDFGKYKDRKAARISFIISALIQKNSRFIDESFYLRPYHEMAAEFYKKLLLELRSIIDNVDNYKKYWKEEDDFLNYSEKLVEDGVVTIEEKTDHDIAIVSIPTDLDSKAFSRFTQQKWGPIHEMAINNKTNRTQIIVVQGQSYSFKYRYETWVQFKTFTYPFRVNM